jgi:hypothetical protein
MTNNNTLGAVATKFGFDTEIKNMHPGLASAVASFGRTQIQNGHLLPNQVRLVLFYLKKKYLGGHHCKDFFYTCATGDGYQLQRKIK